MRQTNSKIKLIMSKLPDRKNWLFWIALALFFKTFFFVYKVCLEPDRFANTHYDKSFAAEAPDTYSYFGPIETLLKTGQYYDSQFGDIRMPGYGWLYWLLRLFLPFNSAANALVIIQLALSAISVYALAEISFIVFRRKRYFYATFGLYAISTFVSIYDHALLTESLCASSFILSIYFLIKSKESASCLLLSGLFLTWCIFMKPVIAPILLLFVLYLLLKNAQTGHGVFNFNWKRFLIFLIPFILIDGAWVFRNYEHYKRIIPLTKSVYYSASERSVLIHLYKFMQSYGGSIAIWEPGSDILFFIERTDFKTPVKVVPPQYIYTSKFNYDSLVVIKNLIKDIQTGNESDAIKNEKEQYVSARLDDYAQSIKKEKPFVYNVRSRINLFKTYFVHSGTHNLFYKGSFELNKIELLIKVFYSFLYVIVIIGGFLGIFYLLFTNFRNAHYLVLSLSGLYFAFVFPFLLRMDQIRYFVPAYPIFLLFTVYLLMSMINKIFKLSNG